MPTHVDRSGRTLAEYPNRHYRLRNNDVCMYSRARYSCDSQYFGPTKLSDIFGVAHPLWTSMPVDSLSMSNSPSLPRSEPQCSEYIFLAWEFAAFIEGADPNSVL